MNGKMLIRLLTVLILATLAGALGARADTVNFDNYTSPTDNDLVNHFNSSSTQSPSGGITGGAVLEPAGTSIYKVNFNPLAGLTTSVFFKIEDVDPFPPGGPSGRVGFTGSPTGVLEFFSEQTYFWAEFYNDTGLNIFNRDGFPGAFNTIGTITSPGFGNWLKITLSESYLGDNRFNLSASLENYGMTGMEAPTLLIGGSITVTNGLAAADPSVFAAFGGSYYNTTAFDNFEVVPEPGAIHIVALGGLLIGFLRVKRPLFNFLSRVVSE
jgi:hypothetical protein